MANKIILPALVFISFLAFSCSNSQQPFEEAKGWIHAGSEPASYEMGIDKGAGPDGKNVASIKSTISMIKGFGTLMQQCLPDKYLDKRVKITADIKSKDVTSWAGLWFRVDGQKPDSALSFDNMQDRAIRGTTDWKKYEIVLDVPKDASNLAYGVLMDGTGQVWFDNVSFEIVDPKTPVTGVKMTEPTNLNFDDKK